jgi:hypothetical protein
MRATGMIDDTSSLSAHDHVCLTEMPGFDASGLVFLDHRALFALDEHAVAQRLVDLLALAQVRLA